MTAFLNRRTGLTLAALAALGLASTAAQAQTVFTSWTFENSPVTTPVTLNASPITAIGKGTASTLGMAYSGVAYAGGVTSSTDASDIVTSPGSSTSPNGTPTTDQNWRVRGTNGWNTSAGQYSQGAQFLTSTVGEKNISVTFDWNPTAQGVGDLELQYTTDGKTFQNAALFSTNKAVGSAFYNGLSYTFGAAANNDANFGVRMVNAFTGAAEVNTTGAALNNSSGNWRFDNVNFTGTPAAVPEASTTISFGLLLALGLGGLAIAKKRSVRAN